MLPSDGPPVAVIDGGCTHVCFNDVHAFRPGTLRPPAKPTYMRLGDDSQVTVEGIGVVDIELKDDSGGSVRYTRKAAYYTPGMSHSLIPENKEWKLYGTRVRKEDENMLHLANGSVRISDETGLYTVEYRNLSAAEDDAVGEANLADAAKLSKHEANYHEVARAAGPPVERQDEADGEAMQGGCEPGGYSTCCVRLSAALLPLLCRARCARRA